MGAEDSRRGDGDSRRKQETGSKAQIEPDYELEGTRPDQRRERSKGKHMFIRS